jgi:hypothetical protein
MASGSEVFLQKAYHTVEALPVPICLANTKSRGCLCAVEGWGAGKGGAVCGRVKRVQHRVSRAAQVVCNPVVSGGKRSLLLLLLLLLTLLMVLLLSPIWCFCRCCGDCWCAGELRGSGTGMAGVALHSDGR